MCTTEKRKLINSLFSFSCSAFVIGFFFYSCVSFESYYRYENLINIYSMLLFFINIIIAFLTLKFSHILSDEEVDYLDNSKTIGLQNGNILGLLFLSFFNILLFNPFFSFVEFFDKGEESLNLAYLAMTCSLFVGAVLLYTSRQQIKLLSE